MNTFSATQTAEQLGMTKDGVLKAIKRGVLKATLIAGPTGDGYRITPEEIDAAVALLEGRPIAGAVPDDSGQLYLPVAMTPVTEADAGAGTAGR